MKPIHVVGVMTNRISTHHDGLLYDINMNTQLMLNTCLAYFELAVGVKNKKDPQFQFQKNSSNTSII